MVWISCTGLGVERRELWKDDLPWRNERSSSVRQTLELFQRQWCGNFWEVGWSACGLFWEHGYCLELNCREMAHQIPASALTSFSPKSLPVYHHSKSPGGGLRVQSFRWEAPSPTPSETCFHVLDETLYEPRSPKCVPMFWMRLYMNQGPQNVFQCFGWDYMNQGPPNVFPCLGWDLLWTKVPEMCSHVLDETLYKPRSTKCVPMFWMRLYINQGPRNVFLCFGWNFIWTKVHEICFCFGWNFICTKVPQMCAHVLDETLYEARSPKCVPMFWMGPQNVVQCFGWNFMSTKVPHAYICPMCEPKFWLRLHINQGPQCVYTCKKITYACYRPCSQCQKSVGLKKLKNSPACTKSVSLYNVEVGHNMQ